MVHDAAAFAIPDPFVVPVVAILGVYGMQETESVTGGGPDETVFLGLVGGLTPGRQRAGRL